MEAVPSIFHFEKEKYILRKGVNDARRVHINKIKAMSQMNARRAMNGTKKFFHGNLQNRNDQYLIEDIYENEDY